MPKSKLNQLMFGLVVVAVSSAVAVLVVRETLLSCARPVVQAKETPSSKVTVASTGLPAPADANAIQEKLDNPAIDVVKLSGANGPFDFGADGGVRITRAGVTVEGEKGLNKRPVINGGGAAVEITADYPGDNPANPPLRYVFLVTAPGVAIRGLELRNFATQAILVHGNSLDPRPVVIDDNVLNTTNLASLSDMSQAIGLLSTGGWPIRVSNNTTTGPIGGIGAYWVGYYMNGSQRVYGGSPLDIVNNEINVNIDDNGTFPADQLSDGILVWSWKNWNNPGTDPNWGDNGPVRIIGNKVHLNNKYRIDWENQVWPIPAYGGGIMAGRSAQGLNYCLVANNTITGYGYSGIGYFAYGHDAQITGNDLSGLTAWSSQIEISAQDVLISKNILGPLQIEGYSSAISIFSLRYHEEALIPLPTENITVIDNDYTHIGSSWGGIYLDSGANWGGGWDGNEVRNNTIVEPAKSWGVKKADLEETLASQIYMGLTNNGEGPQMVHDNTILGLNATKQEVKPAVKDAKKMMEEARKKIYRNMFKKMNKK